MKAAAAELIRIWTEALVPVCNHSLSHARQEVKWLLQHSKHMAVTPSALNALAGGRLNQDEKTKGSAGRSGTRGGLSDKEVELMQSFVDQRTKGRKPLQYILGSQPFMDLEILVRPPTLIPRWETEEWTSRLATILKRSCNIIGVDIHPKAIELARENQIKNIQMLNQNRVLFRRADLQEPTAVDTFLSWLTEDQDKDHRHHNVLGTMQNSNAVDSLPTTKAKLQSLTGFNLVVSNPPYIAHSEYETLEPEVALWEDPKALLADGDDSEAKLDPGALERIHGDDNDNDISNGADGFAAERHWRNGLDMDNVRIPELVLEIGGDHQVESVTEAVRRAGFRRVEVWKDLADRARCIVAAR
ncbi:hypothetical protein BGZ75_004529 [Mortierella antarctica]|nr:hypothetical protein BGZ75_004529 [Mortierella antarctica]